MFNKHVAWDRLNKNAKELTPLVKDVISDYARLRALEVFHFTLVVTDSEIRWEWWMPNVDHTFTYHFFVFLDVDYDGIRFRSEDLPPTYGFKVARTKYKGYFPVPLNIDWSRFQPSPIGTDILKTANLTAESLREVMGKFETISEEPTSIKNNGA
ncbi:MAG: hypothetical protein HY327_09295 [Chloroflexi bacterium]|nr:hypothetical protein [Chloroflexota bacterium]